MPNFLSWGCDPFFSRKINSFQDKSPDAYKQCIPQGLTGMFLCQLCIFYQFSKLETVAFCSNRGRNEHLNIYAKPLNCPVNTALRWNPEIFKCFIHKHFSSHLILWAYREMHPVTSPKDFLTPETLTWASYMKTWSVNKNFQMSNQSHPSVRHFEMWPDSAEQFIGILEQLFGFASQRCDVTLKFSKMWLR